MSTSMTDLYNSKIVSTQKVRRTGSWTGKNGKGYHDGNLVTLDNGSKYLIHNGPGYNKVITPSSNMSSKWHSYGTSTSHKNYTVGKAMSVQKNWSIVNNCTTEAYRVDNGGECVIL